MKLLLAGLLSFGLMSCASGPRMEFGTLDHAINAVGGADALGKVKTIAVRGTVKQWEPEQSEAPGGDMRFAVESSFSSVGDFSTRSVRTDWEKKYAYPAPRTYKFSEIVTPQAGYVMGVDTTARNAQSMKMDPPAHTMSSLRLAATQRELRRASPLLLLDMKSNPDRVRSAPDVSANGVSYPSLAYEAGNMRYVVAFDRATGLPARIRTLDYDNIWGDVNYDLVLSNWREVSGIKIPMSQKYELNGRVISDMALTDVQLNTPVAAESFAIPPAMLATAAQAGRDKLTLVVPPRLASFGLWVEQLVAESTGKQGKGIVPIVGEAPLAEYDGDRVAVVLELPGEHADLDVIDRLRASGAPVVTLRMSSVLALGAEFFRWEVATATAGFLLGINPFDQPNVQQAKEATGGLLAAFEANGSLPALAIDASFDDVHLTLSDAAREQLRGAGARAFLGTVGRGDYLGIMAYVSPGDAALAQVFEHFRSQAGALTRAATMFGYGPRYLHSTGQLHKGGPPNGVFVIISPVQSDDLAIPGERYSFGTLGAAQAYGDFASLNQAGRRALLLRVPSPNPSAIAQTLKGLLPPHIL